VSYRRTPFADLFERDPDAAVAQLRDALVAHHGELLHVAPALGFLDRRQLYRVLYRLDLWREVHRVRREHPPPPRPPPPRRPKPRPEWQERTLRVLCGDEEDGDGRGDGRQAQGCVPGRERG